MKKDLLPAIVLCVACSCTPANDEVTDEHIKVDQPAAAQDTLPDTSQDGVQAPLPDTDLALPLPQPVMEQLEKRYPGWQQPLLASGIAPPIAASQGPLEVRGDFNNDTLQDIALQVQSGKDVVIVAMLQDSSANYKAYELQRDILFNDRGKLESLYYLHLVKSGTEIKDTKSGKAVILNADAVALALADNTSIYVFRNGNFSKVTPAK